MPPDNEERRPGGGAVLDDQRPDEGADRVQSSARPTPGRIAVARCRARLVALAQAAGRPVRTLADEREHAAARRRAEVDRIRRVGE